MKLLIALLFFGYLLHISPKEKNVVHIVKMEGMKFNPSRLEIREGETVRWVNASSSSHNVVASDKSFKSKMLSEEGDQFEYTFEKTGVFNYYCQPHRLMGMKGTVVVTR